MTTEHDPLTWLPIPLATGTETRRSPTDVAVRITAIHTTVHLEDGTTIVTELDKNDGAWRTPNPES